jgi:hypothetical protein
MSIIPVSPDKLLPPIPAGGFHSEDEIAKLPGVRVMEAADISGLSPGTYAYSRQTWYLNHWHRGWVGVRQAKR